MSGFALSAFTSMRRFFAALCVGAVAACTSLVDPDVSFDAETDFSRYSTYGWSTTGALQDLGPESLAQVRATIERMLADKGFTQAVDSDFPVGFPASQLAYTRPVRPRYTTRPSTEFADSDQDQAGESVLSLAINITATATRRSLWRGSTSAVSGGLATAGVAPRLAAKILGSFPPQ